MHGVRRDNTILLDRVAQALEWPRNRVEPGFYHEFWGKNNIPDFEVGARNRQEYTVTVFTPSGGIAGVLIYSNNEQLLTKLTR